MTLDLEEIERRANAATNADDAFLTALGAVAACDAGRIRLTSDGARRFVDALSIAREDVPALAAEVRRLTARAAEVERVRDTALRVAGTAAAEWGRVRQERDALRARVRSATPPPSALVEKVRDLIEFSIYHASDCRSHNGSDRCTCGADEHERTRDEVVAAFASLAPALDEAPRTPKGSDQ